MKKNKILTIVAIITIIATLFEKGKTKIPLLILSITTLIVIYIAERRKTKKEEEQERQKNLQHIKTPTQYNIFTNTKKENQKKYTAKKICTENEIKLYKKLKELTPPKYTVQMQIPLSSIVKKNINNYYINELFRTIDFGIIEETGEIKVLIELNDKTHLQKKRIERDIKVKNILEEANIPLITLWSNQIAFTEYIKHELSQYIETN